MYCGLKYNDIVDQIIIIIMIFNRFYHCVKFVSHNFVTIDFIRGASYREQKHLVSQ